MVEDEELFSQIMHLCESKVEEFALLGYENVSAEEIWACVSSAYKELPPMHKIVNDILTLKINKYMNWIMLKMYKNSN
ncbi:post-transcriptional regulator [Brevibacillus fulvus]|uniref:Post-transcriptional regulator n=1 Tax=Brevibacillus fulvus TaxID=1125967 RepID=A0A939BUU9_9BACL|nr:post-transcriptional regulator [Brevibacillus fulvus]MBM7589981.1 hypothetical protein [Brevibacillus fulvus]